MAPHTQADGIIGIGEDEQRYFSIGNGAEARAMRVAAAELAANLIWLPGTTSSDTFAKRCEKLGAGFESIFKGVDAAFAQAPKSEDLLWLRDNAQQLSAATRQLATELGPLTNLPHVSSKDEIVPRVLAIAQAFFAEADATFNKSNFTAFCLAFEETTPLEFHEIGALVPAAKAGGAGRDCGAGRRSNCGSDKPAGEARHRLHTNFKACDANIVEGRAGSAHPIRSDSSRGPRWRLCRDGY